MRNAFFNYAHQNYIFSLKRCRNSFIIFLFGLVLMLLSTSCTQVGGDSTNISGHLKISGSTALLPLVQNAASSYMKLHPQAHIDVAGGGSVLGLNDVTQGKSTIGDSDIYADPATYPSPNLTDHIVCVTPFVMVINLNVKNVSSLTKDQIKQIFSSGTLTNWSQVGGPNLAIQPIVRPATSGTRATFRKYILDGLDERGKLSISDSSQSIRNIVASTPGAISYLAASVVDTSVKAIQINNYSASQKNISAGLYDFWSYEHMYTMDDDSTLLTNFLSYMLSDNIQKQALNLRYIPINEMDLSTSG